MPPLHHASKHPGFPPYALLLLICLAGYWPLSLSFFSVKNDAIHYFLPFRYQFSNAIQQGIFPFWSPYVYLGYPLQGDMQSGAWNPVVFLISLFSKYNIYLFHFEYLLYIFIAGVGMYRLSALFTSQRQVQLLIAAAYMLSGYLMGSGQFINWVASAAFVPLVLEQYYRLLRDGRMIHALGAALFLWLLLVCGYPADLVYTAYIMAAMAIMGIIMNRSRSMLLQQAKLHGAVILAALCLCAPALVSYTDLMPYYQRGSGATLAASLQNSYRLQNFISLLSPWTVGTPGFESATDPTGRNIYFGIVPLLLLCLSFFTKWTAQRKFLLALLVFSFLFMMGDGFGIRALTYHILPGMSGFRHPSHFRLYAIIAALLLAAGGAGQWGGKRTKIATAIFLLLTIAGVIASKPVNLLQWLQELPASTSGENIKAWIQALDPETMTAAGFLLQALFLVVILMLLRWKKSLQAVTLVSIINLFLFGALFPVQFVSKTPPSIIQKILHERKEQDRGLDLADTVAINSRDAFNHFETAGLSYFYNGRIAISPVTNSPSFLMQQEAFLEDSFLYREVSSHPPLYLAHAIRSFNDTSKNRNCVFIFSDSHPRDTVNACGAPGKIISSKGNYNQFSATVQTDAPMYLHLTQNFHHHWRATIDGKQTEIIPSNKAFMSIRVPAGKHEVTWTFRPSGIYLWMVLSGLTLLFVLLYSIIYWKRRRHA